MPNIYSTISPAAAESLLLTCQKPKNESYGRENGGIKSTWLGFARTFPLWLMMPTEHLPNANGNRERRNVTDACDSRGFILDTDL